MNKKRKIITWIIICSLWNLSVITIHIIMRSQLKFPTLNFEFFGWLIPVFMTVPFHGLFFGILSVYRKRFMKGFAKVYTTVGILCYIFFVAFVTLGFSQWEPGLYPLVSETDDVSHYLILDYETEYEKIYKVLPERVPENAQNIRYEYHYAPIELDYTVDAQWRLPENDFEEEKERVSAKAHNCTDNGNKTVYSFFWSGQYDRSPGALYNIEIEFDDGTRTVSYHLLKNVITS